MMATHRRNGASEITALNSPMNDVLVFGLLRTAKGPTFFSNSTFVKDHLIVAPIVELQFLERWCDMRDVVIPIHYDEGQRKNRERRVDLIETVVAALIDVDDQVGRLSRIDTFPVHTGPYVGAVRGGDDSKR